MKKIYTTFALVLCIMLTTCKKYESPTNVLEYTLSEVKVLSTIAYIEGDYKYDTDIKINVLYGKNSDLSDALKKEAETENRHFNVVITGLETDVQYYYCVEFDNNINTMRTEIVSFVTMPEDNNYMYVDLGLPSGLRWATHNVGATSPEDYGEYYAWGELYAKNTYTADNSLTYGIDIIDISANEQYDVAYKKWGDLWKVPNNADFEELIDNCTMEWTIMNDVNGMKLIGPNGNSIFLPAAGYMDGSESVEPDVCAYWSSKSLTELKSYVYFAVETQLYNTGINRYYGCLVRPVYVISAPKVVTKEVGAITTTSAECSGVVTSEGGSFVYERGFCWSSEDNPTIDGNHVSSGLGIGEFSVKLTNLESEQKYYVRAYAVNEKGIAYGEQKTFTTLGSTLEKPKITKGEIIELTATTIRFEAFISSDGGAEVTSKGLCWSKSGTPDITDNRTDEGAGIGEFTSTITGLEPTTIYYVRTYATNSVGTSYGAKIMVATDIEFEVSGTINGYEYVDLGLPSGLKWATHNVGAETYRDYGEYYAWGEIETKDVYDSYNSTMAGVQISDISGNSNHDVARAKWQSTWRMPTQAEMQELIDNCTFSFYQSQDVNGVVVTGPNGNCILLPAAGYNYQSLIDDGGGIYYWSSQPGDDEEWFDDAIELRYKKDSQHAYIVNAARWCGMSVRPVSK